MTEEEHNKTKRKELRKKQLNRKLQQHKKRVHDRKEVMTKGKDAKSKYAIE